MKVKVVLHPEKAGGYSVEVLGFPGWASCGDTREEALANIREAFEGAFEATQDVGEVHPEDRTPDDEIAEIEV